MNRKFSLALGLAATLAAAPLLAQDHPKNWTPPAHKILAQAMSDEIMKAHPELISITFHGVPPGAAEGTYTMFAGSYLDRIGNVDDPDDVDIQKLGITILDTRWHRTKDPVKKIVVMAPLRDASGENIGELVMAYHHEGTEPLKTETDFFTAGVKLRDQLQPKIKSLAALFEPAK